MVSETRLAAHIKKLRERDDLVRSTDLALNAKFNLEGDPLPFVRVLNPTQQRLADGAVATVIPRYHGDATEAEYMELAALGYELEITPREVFDLHWFGQSLALFKRIRVTGLSIMYSGWEALEQMRAVESLSFEANPPVTLRLDDLQYLRHLGISGTNALSAAANRSLTSLSLTFARLPQDVVIEPQLQRLAVTVSAGELDLGFVADRTRLVEVRLAGASSVSLAALRDSHRLESLVLEDCKEISGGSALVGLDNLERVEFLGVRAVRDIDSLIGLRAKKVYVDRNYAFDPDFESRAGGENAGWYIEKYRGAPTRSIPGIVSAERSEHPFYVRTYATGLFQVTFDEWKEYESLFAADDQRDVELSDEFDFVAQQILSQEAPTLLETDGLYFDSDAEMMRIITPSSNVADRIATVLATAWNTPGLVQKLVHGAPK